MAVPRRTGWVGGFPHGAAVNSSVQDAAPEEDAVAAFAHALEDLSLARRRLPTVVLLLRAARRRAPRAWAASLERVTTHVQVREARLRGQPDPTPSQFLQGIVEQHYHAHLVV